MKHKTALFLLVAIGILAILTLQASASVTLPPNDHLGYGNGTFFENPGVYQNTSRIGGVWYFGGVAYPTSTPLPTPLPTGNIQNSAPPGGVRSEATPEPASTSEPQTSNSPSLPVSDIAAVVLIIVSCIAVWYVYSENKDKP